MGTVLTIAFRNLLQAKRRTFLLGLAVAIVAALFLVLRVVSASVGERMIDAATTLSAGHVNVSGFYKTRLKNANPIVNDRDKLRALVKQAVPEAVSVIDRHRGWGRLIGPASSINSGLSGIIYEDEGHFFDSLRLAPESEYKEGGSPEPKGSFADLKKPNSILIFSGQAKKLGVTVGDTLTVVIEGGTTNTADLTVAAVASDIGFMSNFSVFVPRQTVLDLYRLQSDTTGVIMVYLPDPSTATAVMARLRDSLGKAGYTVMDHDPNPFFMKFDKVMGEDWLGQRLDLTIWSDEISYVLWITSALDVVTFFVIAVLALIIVGGIMNSMWMAVRERTKEIGTMRAIGAPRHLITRLFLAEAMLLGLFAATLGVAFGSILTLVVNSLNIPVTNDGERLFLMANTLKFNLHASQVASTLVLFTLVTGLAALYPALMAARLRPVEALMHTK